MKKHGFRIATIFAAMFIIVSALFPAIDARQEKAANRLDEIRYIFGICNEETYQLAKQNASHMSESLYRAYFSDAHYSGMVRYSEPSEIEILSETHTVLPDSGTRFIVRLKETVPAYGLTRIYKINADYSANGELMRVDVTDRKDATTAGEHRNKFLFLSAMLCALMIMLAVFVALLIKEIGEKYRATQARTY
jgi:hypothetical protein